MSWYGNYNESTRQLDALIDTKPTFASLLLYPDFIQQLKSFNPKLLDYVTNSPTIPQQIVTYISVTPSQEDSVDRKYKLPLLTVEIVETETTCIINGLLKQSAHNYNYFLSLFDMLKQQQILPLLAGYFSRVNLVLCKTRYKQALQSVYSVPRVLELLIEHSENQTIAHCLPLYLCIQSSKNVFLSEDKIAIKMGIVRSILHKIQTQRVNSSQRGVQVVENLCLVLREIIQRYYLINNGKQMLQIILQEKYVHMVISLIGDQSQNSFPAMNLALSFLKYYSLSAFNSEEGNEEQNRKNMERLESQPFIRLIAASFGGLLDKVRREKTITLYGYNLLQVLCHCITLSSNKILTTIKENYLFPALIDLLFKNEYCNILHKLVERTFLHVFTTEKNIYEKYKQYLFCDISVIDLTAKKLLDLFPQADCLEKAKSKGYFGILIKIIKIYSSISTVNVHIREAIKAKAEIWSKMSNKIIKPYEAACQTQMGQLKNVPQTTPVEFTVRRNQNQMMPRLVQNSEALEQVKREQQTMTKTLQLNDLKKQHHPLSETKIEDDSFFKSPLEDSFNKRKSDFENLPVATNTTQINTIEFQAHKQSPKKSISFTQFLNQKKVEVGEQIKMQRSQSGEKRLSADKKTRLTSPSPSRKKNSWKQEQSAQEQKKDKKISLTKDMPKIPVAHKNPQPNPLAKSTFQQPKKLDDDENKRMLSLSMANLQTLKKTTIYRTNQTPTEKKCRYIQQKDKALLAYLGLRT